MARATGGASRVDAGLLLACLMVALFALIAPSRLREPTAAAMRNSALAPLVELERKSASLRAAIEARDSVLRVQGDSGKVMLLSAALEAENEQLRELLGLAARMEQGFVIADVVRAGTPEDPFTIVLGAGSAAGVEPFSPVVTARGLVGMVRSVDASTSQVILWAHPDHHVSAISEDERALGIVQPHLGSGAERWLLEMRGVAFRAQLDTGTRIVTAGLAATFPRGIPIGTVIGEIATTEKWARTYLLRPAVLPEAIGPVMVLPPPRVAEGVSGVWSSVSASDSAARAIAAAGDSVARAMALDELAARRAALDSTAADSARRDTSAAARARMDSIRRDSVRADSVRRARADSARRPTGPPPPLPEVR